jgi:histidine phosphotransferase ChpT
MMSLGLPYSDDDPAGPPPSPVEIASKVAQRLCHDFMSPASGIISGLDLLEDASAQELRGEAMELIASSARRLVEALTFARVAFADAGEPFDNARLESLARGVFAHLRPQIEWAVEAPQLPSMPARVLLNLVQLAGGALASGGVARVTARTEATWTALFIDAVGERARLHPEVAAGLRGERLSEGLSGRWVQAWCLHALVRQAGGLVAAEVGPAGVAFKAAVPT